MSRERRRVNRLPKTRNITKKKIHSIRRLTRKLVCKVTHEEVQMRENLVVVVVMNPNDNRCIEGKQPVADRMLDWWDVYHEDYEETKR